MKNALLISFILFSFLSKSQLFDGLGVHTSAHTSYYKLVEYKSEKILGLDIGFNYDASINELAFFRTGLTYTTLGEKETYGIIDNNGSVLGNETRFFYHYYLTLPAQVHIKLSKLWLGLGANLNYYLSSRIKDHMNDVKEKSSSNRDLMLGVYVSMGLQEKINDKLYYHI